MDRASQTDAGIEAEQWRRFKEAGDLGARDALITRYVPLARSLAQRHRTTGVHLEDLAQVANVGLIAAVDNFDPGRGLAFTTFAVPVIRGELRRELGKSGWAVQTPRQLQQRMRRMRRASETLTGRLGRMPSAPELAAEADLSVEEVQEAMRVELAMLSHTEYLGRRASGRRRDDVEVGLDERFELIDDASTIARAFATLSSRQQQVLRLSFIDELPQHEIANEIGVSQRQVSRILRQALERMERVTRRAVGVR